MPKKPREKNPYQRYLASTAWKVKRRAAVFRDGAQCRHCGSRHKLQVHHLTYKRLGRELMDDLITLCNACHEKAHGIHSRKQAA
ncbi:MAG: HNH endonuclease [Pseudomonadota bacterium]